MRWHGSSLVALVGTCLAGCARAHLPPPLPAPAPVELRLRADLSAAPNPGEVRIDEDDGLSPDEAALLALDHNPTLRAVRARHGVAEAEILAAGLLPNPHLEGSLAVPLAGAEAPVLGYGAGLAWDLRPLLSRAARVRAATRARRSVDLEVAWQEWQVALGAKLHTARLIYLSREIEVARGAVAHWHARVEALRQARAAGAATELSAARGRRSEAEWTLRVEALERQRVTERAALALALGLEPGRLPTLETSWHPPTSVPSPETLIEELPERRLDLVALRYARRSGDAALRAAVLGRFPPLEVAVQTQRDVDGLTSAQVGVRIALPIFDRNQAAVARASARRHSVEMAYDARAARARSETRRLAATLDLLAQEVATAHTAASAASRLAKLAEGAAAAGTLDPVLASDQQDQAFRARLRALEVEASYAETRIALSLSSGVALP